MQFLEKRKYFNILLATSSFIYLGLLFLLPQAIPSRSARSCSRSTNPINSELTSQPPLISFGEKTLFPDNELSYAKQEGIKAINEKRYDEAVNQLESSLKNQKNDPETLIYLNNARIDSNKNIPKYTIAVSVPIGTNRVASLEILRGVAQAQEKLNMSPAGINGKRLRVAIADDKNLPENAKQIALTFVKNTEILGVVGHFGSTVTKEAGTIYCGQLVAISPTSTSVKFLDRNNPYIFTTVASDAEQAKALANYMVRTLKKKNAIAFYNPDREYSKSLTDEFKAAVSLEGGQVFNIDKASDLSVSVRESLNMAVSSTDAQVLMLAPSSEDFARAHEFLKANQDLNEKRLTLLGGDSVSQRKTLSDWNQFAEEMVVAVPWHKDIIGDSASEFLNTYSNIWGSTDDLNWRTALAYDATQTFIEALKSKENPTRAEVQQIISSSNFSAKGSFGSIRFLPSGDRNAPFGLVKVCPNAVSGGYKFVPVQNLKQPNKCDTGN